MIKCFVTFCLVAAPHICQPPLEITPVDRVVTSPMECMWGGAIYFAQERMAQQPPDGSSTPAYFAKMSGVLIGDGSGIVETWLAEQRARAKRMEPQIK